jgi:uncharacterized protein (DUF58 family)
VSPRGVSPLSGLGAAVLAAGAVAAVTGAALGWAELASVGATLLLAVAVAALATLGRSTYAVELDLSGRRVRVGERAVGRLAVRNTSRRRLLPARVELPVGRGAAEFPLPSLGPDEEHEDVFAVPTSRRAVVVVGPVRSVRGDPWGLVRRRLEWTDPVDLYVHPATAALGTGGFGLLRDLEGQATRTLSDSDLSFHALRDYVPGDDRRHIHWRSSARLGDLMVRQFEDTRRSHTVVALALDPADYADDDELELAVSVAASVGLAALREERDVTVLAGTGPLRVASPRALLDDCSALVPDPEAHRSGDLARWAARAVPQASIAVLVGGSASSPADLRAHAATIPSGVRAVVVACDRSAPAQVRTDGTLTLVRLPALADLPRALRQAVAR